MKIPLVALETNALSSLSYSDNRIYLLDNRTGIYHILPTTKTYIASNNDSLSYSSFAHLDNFRALTRSQNICSDVFSCPADRESIRETQLLKKLPYLLRTCQTSLIIPKEYSAEEIHTNIWLVSISVSVPITMKCERKYVSTTMVQTNIILNI